MPRGPSGREAASPLDGVRGGGRGARTGPGGRLCTPCASAQRRGRCHRAGPGGRAAHSAAVRKARRRAGPRGGCRSQESDTVTPNARPRAGLAAGRPRGRGRGGLLSGEVSAGSVRSPSAARGRAPLLPQQQHRLGPSAGPSIQESPESQTPGGSVIVLPPATPAERQLKERTQKQTQTYPLSPDMRRYMLHKIEEIAAAVPTKQRPPVCSPGTRNRIRTLTSRPPL